MLITTDRGHTAGPRINSIRAAAKVMTWAEALPPLYLKLGPNRRRAQRSGAQIPPCTAPTKGCSTEDASVLRRQTFRQTPRLMGTVLTAAEGYEGVLAPSCSSPLPTRGHLAKPPSTTTPNPVLPKQSIPALIL